MALGTDGFTKADLDVMAPEIWGPRMNDFFEEELRMAPFFVDRSEELLNGGDTVKTPTITEMTASAKVTNSQVVLSSPTETSVDLVVNEWPHVAFVIEDREAAQVARVYQIQETYARKAAYTVASEVESAIAALFATFTASVGTSTSAISDATILASLASLRSAKVPGMQSGTNQVAFMLHPDVVYKQVMTIDKFSLLQNTAGADPVLRGMVGTLYGIPVIDSTFVTNVSGANGRNNALVHTDAIHWAKLSLPTTPNSYTVDMGIRLITSHEHAYLGYLTTADICYGVVKNRDEAGVRILTQA